MKEVLIKEEGAIQNRIRFKIQIVARNFDDWKKNFFYPKTHISHTLL